MNVKRIAVLLNFGMMILFVLLAILWAGSFLSEQRLLLFIVFAVAAFLNLGALIVERIYDRGEKAGRETIE